MTAAVALILELSFDSKTTHTVMATFPSSVSLFEIVDGLCDEGTEQRVGDEAEGDQRDSEPAVPLSLNTLGGAISSAARSAEPT